MNLLPIRTLIASLCAIIALSACVYRMDIEQGNRIETAQLEQLEIGMSKSQVEFLLGTAAVVDLYKPDLWHYVYYFKQGTSQIESRVLTLVFENGLLAQIDGDLSPAE